jgi:hypothetical protein
MGIISKFPAGIMYYMCSGCYALFPVIFRKRGDFFFSHSAFVEDKIVYSEIVAGVVAPSSVLADVEA